MTNGITLNQIQFDPPTLTSYIRVLIEKRYAQQLNSLFDLFHHFYVIHKMGGSVPWDTLEINPTVSENQGLTLQFVFTVGDRGASIMHKAFTDDLNIGMNGVIAIVAEAHVCVSWIDKKVAPTFNGKIDVFVRQLKFDRTCRIEELEDFIEKCCQLYERRDEIGLALGGAGGMFTIHPELVMGLHGDTPILHFRVYGAWYMHENAEQAIMLDEGNHLHIEVELDDIVYENTTPQETLDTMITGIINILRLAIEQQTHE